MKPAKCKVCGTRYQRQRPLQVVCSPACALIRGAEAARKTAAREAAERKRATRAQLEAMRTKPELTRLAQAAFNAFIRARDAGKFCISCGNPLGSTPNSYDCGHYRSVGAAPHMRFVEDNAHGQCKRCNRHLAGNHVEYRKGLVARIGLQAVERIEADTSDRKCSRDDLINLAKHYRAESRRIGKVNG